MAFPAAGDRPVKLSFFGGFAFGRVGAPVASDRGDLVMASLDDLFGHKLKVLLQRVEAKDYLDIVALVRAGLRLERGLGAASALFRARFPVAEALRALTYFEGGDLVRLTAGERQTLVEAVNRVGPIPVVPVVSLRLSTRSLGQRGDGVW